MAGIIISYRNVNHPYEDSDWDRVLSSLSENDYIVAEYCYYYENSDGIKKTTAMSKVILKVASWEMRTRTLLHGHKGGNILGRLMDGRIIPVFDQELLGGNNSRKESSELMNELSKYTFTYDPSESHDFTVNIYLYQFKSGIDPYISKLETIMKEELERRKKAEREGLRPIDPVKIRDDYIYRKKHPEQTFSPRVDSLEKFFK